MVNPKSQREDRWDAILNDVHILRDSCNVYAVTSVQGNAIRKCRNRAEASKRIADWSIEEKVGQLFILAFPGKDAQAPRPLIERYNLGGGCTRRP
jgi:hypothetical protein